MKLELDLDELFPADDGWQDSAADTMRDEMQRAIRELVRRYVTDAFQREGFTLKMKIDDCISSAVRQAAEEIEKLDDGQVLERIL